MIDYFGWEKGIVLTLCIILISIHSKKIWSLPLLITWILFCALRVFAFPLSPFEGDGVEWQSVFDHNAASAIVEFLVVGLAAYSLTVKIWTDIFRWVAIVNVALILWGKVFWGPYGILFNPSMSGTFAVALMPLFMGNRFDLGMLIVTFLAVLCTGHNQPLAILGVLVWLSAIRMRKWRVVILAPFIVGAIGYMLLGNTFLNSNGRDSIWKDSFDWFWEHGNIIWGVGGGTFGAIGPYLSRNYPPKSQFIWMHSDWLQIVFEQGVIGLGLALAVLLALYRNIRRPRYFFAVTAFALWMVANFPMHLMLSALYGAFLIRCVFDQPNSAIDRT